MRIQPVDHIPVVTKYAERHDLFNMLWEFMESRNRYGHIVVDSDEYLHLDSARASCHRHIKTHSLPLRVFRCKGELYIENIAKGDDDDIEENKT